MLLPYGSPPGWKKSGNDGTYTGQYKILQSAALVDPSYAVFNVDTRDGLGTGANGAIQADSDQIGMGMTSTTSTAMYGLSHGTVGSTLAPAAGVWGINDTGSDPTTPGGAFQNTQDTADGGTGLLAQSRRGHSAVFQQYNTSGTNTKPTITVRGNTAQTSHLQSFSMVDETILSYFDINGNLNFPLITGITNPRITSLGRFDITNAQTSGTPSSPTIIKTGDPNTIGQVVKGNLYTPTGADPSTITGLVSWHKADAITGLTDGQAVATWSGSSPTTNDLTQATGTKQPLYKTGIINSLPTVRFDGVDDSMQSTFTLSNPYTIFMVYKHITIGAAGVHSAVRDGKIENSDSLTVDNTPYSALYPGGAYWVSSPPHLFADGVFSIVTELFPTAGSDIVMRENGAVIPASVVGAPSTALGGFTLASIGGATGSYSTNLDVAEVIIYNSVLSAGDTDKIETYLSAKYAITLGSSVPQVSDLEQWQKYDGTVLSFIDAAGLGTFTGITSNGNVTIADAKNIILNATTGTKIGTATSQKLAFYNSTPIVQPTGNVLTALSNLGLVASPTLAVSDVTNLASGTYTPTRSVEANMDANVTMSEAQYMRVGNTVTVSGQFTADPTLTATTTSFEITLPVASNIGAVEDVSGTANCGNIVSMGGAITGVVANDTAKIFWEASDITSQIWSYVMVYQII